MGFLKKMFGRQDPVEAMRQCHARQDWSEVLSLAGQIDRSVIDPTTASMITGWETEAGDALATLNIAEGAWAQESGNLLRAREDYQLAIRQARSPALRERAEQALEALERGGAASAGPATEAEADPQAGCNSCAPAKGPVKAAEDTPLDEESRMELLLATMSPDLADRYLAAGPAFRQAWMAAQDGEPEQALALLETVPAAERNALFLYERGCLALRSGERRTALQDLQGALTLEPDLFPAFDALTEALIAEERFDELQTRLKQNLAEQRFTGYCWARLAELHARRRELEPALAAGLKALDEGVTDVGLILLCAQLLERAERFDEAEHLLMRLPGGGCGGGVHPMLAEFWLRRGQNFDQALESFKGALRQERDNPRWLLRIAQVYLGKGWRREAAEQIERLMQQDHLPEDLRAEIRGVADRLHS